MKRNLAMIMKDVALVVISLLIFFSNWNGRFSDWFGANTVWIIRVVLSCVSSLENIKKKLITLVEF